jgi:tetratricopeptide (TPR) repeat protein
MPAVREGVPRRHPWVDALCADPDREFADFISGYARIEPFGRADAPDAARLLFGPLEAHDPARPILDRAVGRWLEQRRREGTPAAPSPRLERQLREIAEAIRIISILRLVETAADLRRRFVLWNSWAERLAGIPGPDVRAELFSTLALTQRLFSTADHGIKGLELEPFWLAICEQAGGALPDSYLSIAILGLRSLPPRKGMPSEGPWMAGLARWGSTQRPDVNEFSRHWWALRAIYPHSPGHWREALAHTLRAKSAVRLPDALRDFWMHDVGLRSDASVDGPSTFKPRAADPPPRHEREAIVARVAEPIDSIVGQVHRIISDYERYAEATGDDYFLVTSACNIGMRIIEVKDGDDAQRRGEVAMLLARRALAWQPTNVFAWALFRDALTAQGKYGDAELVGWDLIQRFPENEQWRNQLALLLARFEDRQDDAERLLRTTINRFPDAVVSRNQLALLLARSPLRHAEAESLLEETISRFPDNLVSRSQLAELYIASRRLPAALSVVQAAFAADLGGPALFSLHARLLYHLQGPDAALRTLAAGIRQFSADASLLSQRRRLEEGEGLSLDSSALRVAELPSFKLNIDDDQRNDGWNFVRRARRLRRFGADLPWKGNDPEWCGVILDETRRILAEDPNSDYARYLEAELGGGDGSESLGMFSVAFIDALKRKDADKLAELEMTHFGRSQLLDVARVFLFGDKIAAERTSVWLRTAVTIESRPIAALRAFMSHRIEASPDAATLLRVLAANDNVRQDLIESALISTEFTLAA